MNVSEIPLREKPSHGSVKRVSRITEDWMMMKLGLPGFQKFIAEKKKRTATKKEDEQEEKMDSILKLMFENDQDLMSEFLRMQDGLGEYQTIMLATSWNLQKMLAYEEEASEDEFQALLKRCISTLGGTAADFFWYLRYRFSLPERDTGGNERDELSLEEFLRGAVWTFSEARRAIRAASRGESFPISQELDDVLTCESWGISQDLLDKMPEEDVMYRKFVAYARYIEGKT